MKNKKIIIILSITIILLSLISTVSAETSNTWYVSENGSTTGDGSIDNPFKTLNEGLDKSESGDEIYLFNGNYEIIDYNITKTISITGENANKTIITGNNTHNRLFTMSTNIKFTLKNLSLANVNIIPEQETGGAILIEKGTLRMENCNILNNQAKYGAGIYNYDGIAYIYNSTFQENYALTYSGCDGGAGIYNLYGTTYVYNSLFNNNTCKEQQGAGIYNNKGHLTVMNTIFSNNKGTDSGSGGAIYCNDKSYNTITNCKFINNSAWLGGAIYTANGMNGGVGFTNIKNCIFENNTARSNGGAIYNYWEMSILTIENTIFTNNNGRNGGSIYNQWATITLKNNTIINSTAKVSGNEIYNNGNLENVNITILENKTITIKPDETITITATITDDNGNKITGGNLSLYGNNELITTIQIEEGEINYNYTIKENKTLLSGNYTKALNTNLKTSILTTETEIETKITSTNLNINYGETRNYTGKLTTKNNNPIANQKIELNITRLSTKQSKIYLVTTNTNGEYTLPINLAPGQYTIESQYKGEDNYLETRNTNNISIKIKTTTKTEEYTNKVQTPGQLKGELKTANNEKLLNVEIEITIIRLSNNLNKTYTVTTNTNSEYILPINLAQGEYKVHTSFKGTERYSPSEDETEIHISI